MTTIKNPYRVGSVRWCMFTVLKEERFRDNKIQAYFQAVNAYYVVMRKEFNGEMPLKNIEFIRVIQSEIDGIIPARSTFEREWRYIQNKHPEMRGAKYNERHNLVGKVKEQYKN